MPRWGRPPAGRRGKKEWERQQREWEEQEQRMRFEELSNSDSDDDGQGVDLVSDELNFTGGDLGDRTRSTRRVYDYSDNSDDDDEEEHTSGGQMQLVLRDKEEELVARAMERIRRAQAMGKTNVKLTEPERDALERKMAKDRAKGRKPLLATKKSNEARRTSSKSNLAAQSKRKSSRASLNEPNPPGMIIAGSDGQPMYAPLGYLPPASSSRPTSRSGSSQNLRQSPPLSPANYRNPAARRYVSGPEATARTTSSPRPLPDDPNWRPRSSSSAAQPYSYPVDAYGHPYFPPGQPIPAGYAQPSYPNLRQSSYGSSSSNPPLRRSGQRGELREESEGSRSCSADSSDGAGVEVNVVPYGSGYEIVPSGQKQAVPARASPAKASPVARRRKR